MCDSFATHLKASTGAICKFVRGSILVVVLVLVLCVDFVVGFLVVGFGVVLC